MSLGLFQLFAVLLLLIIIQIGKKMVQMSVCCAIEKSVSTPQGCVLLSWVLKYQD